MPEAPTSAKLKHDIDRGLGGDKIDAIDPAAASLGTDDEAAGTPPTWLQITRAHRTEMGSRHSQSSGADWGVPIYIALLITVACVVLGGIVLMSNRQNDEREIDEAFDMRFLASDPIAARRRACP